MSTFLAVLLGAFIAVYGVLILMVLQKPLLGRLALREAVRRPGQTAILVVGLMAAGASIFAVQVFVDSADQAVIAAYQTAWGHDDIELTAGGSAFDAALAPRLASDPTLSTSGAAFQNAIILTTSVTDLDRQVGKPGIQLTGLDLTNQQRFGTFVLSHGRESNGQELTTGRVYITDPLAGALGARVGDHLRVTSPASLNGVELIVADIVQRNQAGAYGASRTIFTSLDTAQQVTGTSSVNLVRISARGENDAEVVNAHQMVNPLTRATAGTAGVVVLETKFGAIQSEKDQAASTRAVFTSLSLVVALAASAMVVNLAVMLAEERRPRLAVLRALGLTRTGLVKVSVIEGGIYSVAGAIAGLPLGLAVGSVLNSELQLAINPGGTTIMFGVAATSLLGSVAAASLITLATLFITSLRTSRMAISSAIRDLPEPERAAKSSWVRLAFLVCGVLVGGGLALAGAPSLRALGGAILIASAGGLVRGRIADRVRYTAIGGAIAAWAIGYVSLNVSSWSSSDRLPGSMMALIVAVVGGSVLVASQLRLLEMLVSMPGRIAAGLRATLRPALAYTTRRPLRSGLVIASFGVIVAILTSLSASLAASQPNYARDSGGWDVRVSEVGTGRLALPPDLQSKVAQQETLASRTFLGPVKWFSNGNLGPSGEWIQQSLTVFGLSDQQLASAPMPLGSWDPKYRDAAAVWAALARDPSLVVGNYSSDTQVDLRTAQGDVHLTVIALEGNLSSPEIVEGVIGSNKILNRLAGSTPGAVLLLRAAPGVAPRALADQVQRATLAQGADATTTLQILTDSYANGQGFVQLLLTIMRVGLLVGVFSLGTIALRAVVERRRAIGVMRAVGFRPGQVLSGIVLETMITTTAGVAVGVITAYLVGTATLFEGSANVFAPDPATLGTALALVYAAVLIVTLLPAIRASRLRPAEALRTMA